MPVPDSIIELIDSSGNNFHAKVVRWFLSDGWHTVVSPYYMDQSQSKARELDLIVEKLWPIRDSFGRAEGSVVVRLLVECKFVAAEAVFWFAPKNMEEARNLVCRSKPFCANNTYTDKHHYIATSPRVAKLFASSNSRTSENDPFFKALNQALNASVAMHGKPPSHPDLVGRHGGDVVLLEFPVVVCSSFSQLYAADFHAEEEPAPIRDNFQLEVKYAFVDRGGTERDDYFFVDFVEFSRLGTFTGVLNSGAEAAAFLASRG